MLYICNMNPYIATGIVIAMIVISFLIQNYGDKAGY